MKWRFSDTSISAQFGVLFTLVFFVPVVSLGLFYSLEFRQIQKENLEELAYVADGNAKQVELLMEERLGLQQTIYASTSIRLALSQADKPALLVAMREYLLADPSIRSIQFFDTAGVSYASTSEDADEMSLPENAREVTKDETGFYEVQMKDGILTGFMLREFQHGNAFRGSLLIGIDLSDIVDLQASYSSLSQTGELLLVAPQNGMAVVFTPKRFADGRSSFPLDDQSVEVRSLNRTSGAYHKATDYRGTQVFAATQYLPSLDWGLLVKKDRDEVLVPVVNLYRIILFAIVTSLLLLFLLGWYLRRYVLSPIKALTKLAKQIQHGMYRGNLTIDAQNEVGSLARAFKTMSEQLLEANQTLEDKVKRRTSRLNQMLKQVRAQKMRDDALLSSIVEGMVATDKEGIIVLANAAACEMLNRPSKKLSGSPLAAFLRLRSLDGQALGKKIDPLTRVLTRREVVRRQEFSARIQGRTSFPLELSAAPVVVDEAFVGAIFILYDLTKEKEVDRLKSEFIAMASHQLRAPLASMKWYGELLAKGKAGSLKKEQAEFVDRINISTRRTISLVDDFLNVSRVERGELKMTPRKVPVRELIRGIVQSLSPDIERNALRVRVRATAKHKTIMADPDMMREILANLIGNAVKYTPKGGEVLVTIKDASGGLRLEVQDSGVGIPANEQKKLFGEFFRASNASKLGFEGTGLGLYTAKRLTDRMGGTIGFESQEGKGSTFWVEI